jgi:hypothetical protein
MKAAGAILGVVGLLLTVGSISPRSPKPRTTKETPQVRKIVKAKPATKLKAKAKKKAVPPKAQHVVKRPSINNPKSKIQNPDPAVPTSEAAQIRQAAARLLARYRAGSVVFPNGEREVAQMRQLMKLGYCCPEQNVNFVPRISLVRILEALASKATPGAPLSVLSLYRKPRSEKSREPHSRGLAADFMAYGGHTIHSRNASEALRGVIAVIENLPPGRYGLGLPKPPNTDPAPGMPAPFRPAKWPFFPAPIPAVILPYNIVLPKAEGAKLVSGRLGPKPWVLRWENERGAPIEDIGSQPLRQVIRDAAKRGVRIMTLFPDAVDHLHLQLAE